MLFQLSLEKVLVLDLHLVYLLLKFQIPLSLVLDLSLVFYEELPHLHVIILQVLRENIAHLLILLSEPLFHFVFLVLKLFCQLVNILLNFLESLLENHVYFSGF